MGIVLPDGILTNSSLRYVRDFIFERTQLLAIVSLPQLAFKYVEAGVRPSLLFLRKLENGERVTNYKIFMSSAEGVGYDATGRPDKNDLPEILENWGKFQKGKNKLDTNSFVMSFNDLEGRLDPFYYQKQSVSFLKKIKGSSRPIVSLGDVAVKIDTGKTPAKLQYRPKGIPIVKVKSVVDSFVAWNETAFVDEELFEKAKKAHLQESDLLILASAHSPEYIGSKVGIVKGLTNREAMSVGEMIIVRLDTQKANPRFVLEYLKTEEARQQLRRSVSGQTAHIYPSDVAKLKMPLPPIEEQNKIAKKFWEIDEAIKNLYQKIQALENKKSVLLAETLK